MMRKNRRNYDVEDCVLVEWDVDRCSGIVFGL